MKHAFLTLGTSASLAALALPLSAEPPCLEDYSAGCVALAVHRILEENADWEDPIQYDDRMIMSLAIAQVLLGNEAEATALLGHVAPAELEIEISDGGAPELDDADRDDRVLVARRLIAEAARASLEARPDTAPPTGSALEDAAGVAKLHLWAEDIDSASRIVKDAVAVFVEAVAADNMAVLRASDALLSAAWALDAGADVDALLEILMRPEMSVKGICPSAPGWTNELPLRRMGHRFIAAGELGRAEEVWRAAPEIKDSWIDSFLQSGRKDIDRRAPMAELAALAGDPAVTPQALVAAARNAFDAEDDPGFEKRVFRRLVSGKDAPERAPEFFDAYPDLVADFIPLLPAISSSGWESADHCEGVGCVGWASALFTRPAHRQAICAYITTRAETFIEDPPQDEDTFSDLALTAIWSAEFCAPSAAAKITAFAEPLIYEIPFSGLGALAVGFLAVAPYAIGDDDTGERLINLLSEPGYGRADGLMFMSEMLSELRRPDRAAALARQAWDIAAPYTEAAGARDPSFSYQVQTLVWIARSAARADWDAQAPGRH